MDIEQFPENSEQKPTENLVEQDTSPEKSVELGLGSTAVLLVGGKVITIQDDPEILHNALIHNQERVVAFFDDAYNHFRSMQHHQNTTISYPPILAAEFGTAGKKYGKVVTPEAYDANTTGGIFYSKADLLPKFHPMWEAVANSGFAPEVIVVGAWSKSGGAQALLMIQPPKIEPGA
jgi:hypothetical protein